jgi:hypothetical protein
MDMELLLFMMNIQKQLKLINFFILEQCVFHLISEKGVKNSSIFITLNDNTTEANDNGKFVGV